MKRSKRKQLDVTKARLRERKAEEQRRLDEKESLTERRDSSRDRKRARETNDYWLRVFQGGAPK